MILYNAVCAMRKLELERKRLHCNMIIMVRLALYVLSWAPLQVIIHTSSPAPSEPSDTNMVDSGQIADLVWARLAPRLDGTDKKADERHKQLLEQIAGLNAECLRKDAQIEDLTNKYTFVETRLERLEQASRANNIMLFNVPEELPGARPIDSVKNVFEKLPATDTPTEMPTGCMRIGKPRVGPAAKPRPLQVVFASGDAKHAALRRGRDIRAKGYGIDVDLSPAQQQERQLKHSRYVALKQQNMSPFWKGARLFYRQDGQVQEALGPRPPAPPPPPSHAPSGSAPAAPSYAQVAEA